MAEYYGLGIFLSVSILFGCWWLINYVLKENSIREKHLREVVDKYLTHLASLISEHDHWSKEANISLTEAIKNQREEHKKLMEGMDELLDEMRNGRRK